MTSRWGFDPVIYELNTAAWLHDVGARIGRSATLADVPDDEWDRVTPPGVDAVWLMGVWERSPEGVRLALESPSHLADFRATLPDFPPDDVIGSAYSIRRYDVDAGSAARRPVAARRGARRPRRAPDRRLRPEPRRSRPPMAERPPGLLRPRRRDDLERAPSEFLAVGDAVIARGRDPYFPPWPDVAQLNAFAPGLRQAAIDTLDRDRAASPTACVATWRC